MSDQAATPPLSPAEQKEQIAELLRNDGALPEPPDEQTPTGDEPDEPIAADARDPDPDTSESGDDFDDELGIKPATEEDGDQSEAEAGLQALAEKAGVSLDDIYDLEIPLGDGREPITLAELKDNAQAYARFEQERNDFEDDKIEQENKILRARGEVTELLAMFPRDKLPPEVLEKAREQYAVMVATERAALHRILPEWKDPDTFRGVKDEMFDAVKDYGFSRAELDNLYDHRLLKLAHDFGRLRRRIQSAKADRKRIADDAPKTTRARGSKGNRGKAPKDTRRNAAVERGKQAAARGDRQEQHSAITEILQAG